MANHMLSADVTTSAGYVNTTMAGVTHVLVEANRKQRSDSNDVEHLSKNKHTRPTLM